MTIQNYKLLNYFTITCKRLIQVFVIDQIVANLILYKNNIPILEPLMVKMLPKAFT